MGAAKSGDDPDSSLAVDHKPERFGGARRRPLSSPCEADQHSGSERQRGHLGEIAAVGKGGAFLSAGHPMSLSRIRPRHTAPLPIPAGTPGREAMGTAADIIAGMVSTGGIDRRRAREILRNCPYALVLDDRSNRLVVVGREYQPLGIEQRCTAAEPDYRP